MWDSTNKIITLDEPIGFGDVQRALSSGCTDLYALCTHKSINIWSRYKPVQSAYEDFSGVKFSDYKSKGITEVRKDFPNYNPNWWKNPPSSTTDAGDCAIQINQYSDAATLISNFNNSWKHKAPVLGTHCARLTDFNGYNPRAINPFAISSSDGVMLTGGDGSVNYTQYPSVRCWMNGNINYDYNLSIDDIGFNSSTPLKNMYFGVVWRYDNAYRIITADTNFTATGTGAFMKEITNFANSAGTPMLGAENTLYPILSVTKHSANVVSVTSGDKMIPLPLDPIALKVSRFSANYDAQVYFIDSSGKKITSVTLNKQDGMAASLTQKMRVVLTNKLGSTLNWSLVGTIFYHYNSIGSSGNPDKRLSTTYDTGSQSTADKNTTTKDISATLTGLYDTSYADGNGSEYPSYIIVNYVLVLPVGYDDVAATATLAINWQ